MAKHNKDRSIMVVTQKTLKKIKEALRQNKDIRLIDQKANDAVC